MEPEGAKQKDDEACERYLVQGGSGSKRPLAGRPEKVTETTVVLGWQLHRRLLCRWHKCSTRKVAHWQQGQLQRLKGNHQK